MTEEYLSELLEYTIADENSDPLTILLKLEAEEELDFNDDLTGE